MPTQSEPRRWTVRLCPGHGLVEDAYDGEWCPICALVPDAYRLSEPFAVVPAEQLEEFVAGLTQALNDHGVPAMPSWREAIDWLAAHGGER